MSSAQGLIRYFMEQHKTMDLRLRELEGELRGSLEGREEAIALKAIAGLLEMKQEFKRHFKEEETRLVPALEAHIMREGGAFSVMEHPDLMAAFSQISSWLDEGAAFEELGDGGLQLISLLKSHTERENELLSRIAEAL